MTGRGKCKASRTNYGGEYQYIFAESSDPTSCHHCVQIFVRTVNIIEKKESGCIQQPRGSVNWDTICNKIRDDQQTVTMYSENVTPINCR